MGPTRPLIFWIGILAAVIAAVVLLHGMLLPFVAGMVLAYLLDRPVNRLERLGLNRAAATLLIIGLFVVGMITLIILLAPFLGAEIAAFIENLPGYSRRLHDFAMDPSRPWLRRIAGEGLGLAERSGADLANVATGWLSSILGSLWSRGRALLSIFSLLVVTPIVTFYLVYDWDRIVGTIDNWVPAEYRETARTLWHDVDEAVGGFLRGQGVICLVLATFYATALKSIGLNHGLLIGITAGLIGFVPYLGALTGVVLSLCMVIVQFGPAWGLMATVVGIFFVGQSLADYVLTPRLVGRRVHLNPVWLMFAVFAFGYLFGFVGILIAVPLAAVISVVVRFALSRYARGDTGPAAAGVTNANAADREPR
jgi:predicted PurR-regulated permease PerM